MQEGPSPAQHLKPETDSSGSQEPGAPLSFEARFDKIISDVTRIQGHKLNPAQPRRAFPKTSKEPSPDLVFQEPRGWFATKRLPTLAES